MHEFWYDYVQPKYGEKAKLCYIDTDSFTVNINKKIYIYTQILQKKLKQDLILQIMKQKDHYLRGKNVTGLMKNELGEKIMTEFAALRPKTYSYLTDDNNKTKKEKSPQKCATQLQNKIN